MDLIPSFWRVTFGGVRLIDFTDYFPLGELPSMPMEQDGESVSLPRAAFARQIAYQNVVNRLEFSRLRNFATRADAMEWQAAHNATMPTDVYGAVLETPALAMYSLAGARLDGGVSPKIVEGYRVAVQYRLLGGAFAAFPSTAKSANFAAAAVNTYVCDLSGGSFTGTLPAAPAIGDFIAFRDSAATWGATFTIARNGLKINGGTSNYTSTTPGAKLTACYLSAAYGWQVQAQ